ncbi:hypothetical protein V8C86DRAFT_1816179 [Haematococcus lacustris]|nr:hypothetical protein QJQ45_016929 [Haematococcus lacustris]
MATEAQRITIVPRLQVISWSLYWKEAMSIDTQCLDPLELEVGHEVTREAVLEAACKALSWQPEQQLHRLEHFTEPWSRVIYKGREVMPGSSVPEEALAPGSRLVVVRKVLKADGWRLAMPDDVLSSDDEM